MADNYEYQQCAPTVYPPEFVFVNESGTIKQVYVNDSGTIKAVFQRRHRKTVSAYAKCVLTEPETKTRYEYAPCTS